MKKIILGVLALTAMITLVACESEENVEMTNNTTTTTQIVKEEENKMAKFGDMNR